MLFKHVFIVKKKYAINMYLITFLKVTEWTQLYLNKMEFRAIIKHTLLAHGKRLMNGEHKQSGVKSPKR